jgi:hypothetical protein
MDNMLYPGHLIPSQPIKFDGFKIRAGERGDLRYPGGGNRVDSIEVYDITDDTKVHNWFLFHCLITDDFKPLGYLDNWQTADTPYSFNTINRPSMFPSDFTNLLGRLYYIEDELVAHKPPISYEDLYQEFCQFDSTKLNKIKTYVLAKTTSTDVRTFTDPSYWRLVMYFSIVENLLGRVEDCDYVLYCASCKRMGLRHPGHNNKQWLKRKLRSLIHDNDIADQYVKVIETVRKKIRNDTVHNGIFPSAVYPGLGSGTFEYNLEDASKAYKTDSHALMALLKYLKELTRIMLLNDLFSPSLYMELRGLTVHSMVFNIQSSSSLTADGTIS